MKVVLFMQNFAGYFRNFEPIMEALLEEGNEVHVALEREGGMDGQAWAKDLQARYPRFTWGLTPGLKLDDWYLLMRELRLGRDYAQALRPEFLAAPELVARARQRASPWVRRLLRFPPFRTAAGRRVLTGVFNAVERLVPPSTALTDHVKGLDPDVVLLTPHLMPGSLHTWTLKSADAIGVRTAICVASWDNLSSKQLIHVPTDRVLVWNETQRREAVELHGQDADVVTVTGAQLYDQWFDWAPSPRDEFCRRVGLDPARPYVLYAAGALFPAETTEAEFVTRWLHALRGSDRPGLADVQVLIRPHPKRVHEWDDVDISAYDDVVLWPRGEGRMPVARQDKADFHDSIFHSVTMVGINTSAMIEAGIIGRRVHTILMPEFEGSQGGTFHFRYLTDVGGGLLSVADDLDDHLSQLAGSLADGPGSREDHRAFIEAFVRPQGMETPSTPIFVDTVVALAREQRPEPVVPGPLLSAARRVLRPLVVRVSELSVARKARAKKAARGRGASRAPETTPSRQEEGAIR
jgi:hypothetical protein